MAKELVAEVPKAKEMFDKAKEILGYDLLQVRIANSMHKGSHDMHLTISYMMTWHTGLLVAYSCGMLLT